MNAANESSLPFITQTDDELKYFKYSDTKGTLSKESAPISIKDGKINYKSKKGTLKISIAKITKLVIGKDDQTPKALVHKQTKELILSVKAGDKTYHFVEDNDKHSSVIVFLKNLKNEMQQMSGLTKILSVEPDELEEKMSFHECVQISFIEPQVESIHEDEDKEQDKEEEKEDEEKEKEEKDAESLRPNEKISVSPDDSLPPEQPVISFSGHWILCGTDNLYRFLQDEGWDFIERHKAIAIDGHQFINQTVESIQFSVKSFEGRYEYELELDGTRSSYVHPDGDEITSQLSFGEDKQSIIEKIVKGKDRKLYTTQRYMKIDKMILKITNKNEVHCIQIFKRCNH